MLQSSNTYNSNLQLTTLSDFTSKESSPYPPQCAMFEQFESKHHQTNYLESPSPAINDFTEKRVIPDRNFGKDASDYSSPIYRGSSCFSSKGFGPNQSPFLSNEFDFSDKKTENDVKNSPGVRENSKNIFASWAKLEFSHSFATPKASNPFSKVDVKDSSNGMNVFTKPQNPFSLSKFKK